MIAWLATWLWQGLTLTLLVTLALRVGRVNAASRYMLWWATLAGVLALAWTGRGHISAHETAPFAADDAPMGAVVLQLPSTPSMLVSIVAVAWIALTSMCLVKIAAALVELWRLKSHTRDFPSERELRLTRWQAVRQNGRPARLTVSDDIQGVAVLGLTRPQIGVAHNLLDQLTDDELDQIVLHEHAHVQRRDDWVQLLQVVLTAVAGLHPAVRWISDRLELEREVACDDWVIARTGRPRSYARCLARVAEWHATRTSLVCAPALFARPSHFTARLERLLDARRDGRTRPSATAVALGLGLVTFGHLQIAALPPLVSESSPIRVAEMGFSIRLSRSPELRIDVGEPQKPRRPVPGTPIAGAALGTPAEHPIAGAALGTPAAARRKASQRPPPERIDPFTSEGPSMTAAPTSAPETWLLSHPYTPIEGDLSLAATLPTDIRAAEHLRDAATLQAAPTGMRANRWTAVAATARRAGLATAATFTRAGTSLASTFTLSQERP